MTPPETAGGLAAKLEELALAYHKNPAPLGEGEYGCPGLTCPGVQRLLRFANHVALEALGAASPVRLMRTKLIAELATSHGGFGSPGGGGDDPGGGGGGL
jgi:hypothetical protein